MIKYAVYLPIFGPFGDVHVLASLARDAEEAGWDGFFIWDHVAGEKWANRMVDPWIALSVIAMETQRVRIGALVTPLPRRRPHKVARETVTIDHLSNGRLNFGVGVGGGHGEWDNLGEESNQKVRGEMLDEALEVLIGLWSSEPFSFDGQYYHIDNALFEPKPVQKPRIPVWVAGYWPRKPPFRRAAQWDGVFAGTTLVTPEQTRDLIAYVKAHRESDEPFDVIHGGITPENPVEAAKLVEPHIESGITWWLEHIGPHAFNADWKGDWPVEAMRARIQAGPPKVEG